MTTPSLSPAERDYIISGLSDATPTRQDGRGLLVPRHIETAYGVAPAANGSARVRLGGTEVVAGITLAVADVPNGSVPKGKEWRAKVEVDATPQAYPAATSPHLQTLSSQLASLITDHFVPSLPPLVITETKVFLPSLHLTVLSADGSVPLALALAARAAFADLAVPKTSAIVFEGDKGDHDLAGIKGAVGAAKGKGRARARGQDDWDLDGGVAPMDGRETLPVLVPLHFVPATEVVFLDASAQEEAACPDRIYVWVRDGRICGVRMEGEAAVDASRIRGLLEEAVRIGAELAATLNTDLP